MKRLLITGMSGAGKSSVVQELVRRGHTAIDTDSDAWCEWQSVVAAGNQDENTPEPDWVWREDRMRELLAQERSTPLFVAGCKSNQGRFSGQFDHVVLLTAPADVLLSRIGSRQDNPYGKSAGERQRILRHIAVVEPLLRRSCDLEIDTAQLGTGQVADLLIRLTRD